MPHIRMTIEFDTDADATAKDVAAKAVAAFPYGADAAKSSNVKLTGLDADEGYRSLLPL